MKVLPCAICRGSWQGLRSRALQVNPGNEVHTRGAHEDHTNLREMSGVPPFPPSLASTKANATLVDIVCARAAAVVGHFSLPALETFPLPAHDAWCSERPWRHCQCTECRYAL